MERRFRRRHLAQRGSCTAGVRLASASLPLGNRASVAETVRTRLRCAAARGSGGASSVQHTAAIDARVLAGLVLTALAALHVSALLYWLVLTYAARKAAATATSPRKGGLRRFKVVYDLDVPVRPSHTALAPSRPSSAANSLQAHKRNRSFADMQSAR